MIIKTNFITPKNIVSEFTKAAEEHPEVMGCCYLNGMGKGILLVAVSTVIVSGIVKITKLIKNYKSRNKES